MPTPGVLGVAEMSISECLARLGSVTTGHLAITHKALPYVVPVHIALVGHDIVVGSCLGDLVPLAPGVVALEAGTFGTGTPSPWTVSVRGFLRRTEDAVPASEPGLVAPAEMFHLSIECVSGWTNAPDLGHPQSPPGQTRPQMSGGPGAGQDGAHQVL
jgi:hypothetical protein